MPSPRKKERKPKKDLKKIRKIGMESMSTNTNENISTSEDIKNIYRNVKSIPSYSSKIVKFLNSYEASSLYKPVRHKYPRRKIRAYYPYNIMMSDTINYKNIARPFNNNFKYIMVLVDVFSKRAFAWPMKSMHEFEALTAMENMIKNCETIPDILITDRGTEYFNSKMKSFFERKNIRHYSLGGKHKASIAERFIRTLKTRLEKYFWDIKKPKWIDVLDNFIDNYNRSYHRSIKMAPVDVSLENRREVFTNLYPNNGDKIRPRLKIGDRVRLLENKTIFTKGYSRSWSLEIYKIKEVFADSEADYYKIEDSAGNVISRKKYYWELNLVSTENDS